MGSTIETWVHELVDIVDLVDEAGASEAFQEWLDVQSRFHDYSHRDTLPIALRCPEATPLAGYRTRQEEFERHDKRGESTIWIWAPISTGECPNRGKLPVGSRGK